jgi:hypothetical protein
MTLKLCTCRNCKHVTYKKRVNPFCSSECRNEYNRNNTQSAILTGATHENSNTEKDKD